MTDLSWRELVKDFAVPAKPNGFWTLVVEYIAGPKKLKLESAGQWNYSEKLKSPCGPDGDPHSPTASANCVNPEAPVGSLIGKIGGSTAGTKDGKIFVVGRLCILDLDEATSGPLFLSINDEQTGYPDNGGELKVTVYEAL